MSAFTWNDTVKVKLTAPPSLRPGALASIVGISAENERSGRYLATFPHGTVYTIEFEDGSAVEIEESLLEKGAFPRERTDSN